MQVKKKNITLEHLLKKQYTGKWKQEELFHRVTSHWDKEQASLFIHSILMGYPTPSIVIAKNEGKEVVISGSQRLEAIQQFYHSYLLLSDNTPTVQGTPIQTMVFNDLPTELQQRFLSYTIEVVTMVDLPVEEQTELFYRLNQGAPLKGIEKNRGQLNTTSLSFIEELTAHPFIQQSCVLPAESKRPFPDQELVLQILLLLNSDNTGLGRKEIDSFTTQLNEETFQKELKAKWEPVIAYLSLAFPTKNPHLRKVCVPNLAWLVNEMIQTNELHFVSPTAFSEWVDSFFLSPPTAYVKNSGAGSSKRPQVLERNNILKTSFVVYKATIKRKQTLEKKQATAIKEKKKTTKKKSV